MEQEVDVKADSAMDAGIAEGASGTTKIARKKKSKKFKLTIVGAVALALVAIGVGAYVWHEQPSFCGTVCHDTMGSYSASWDGEGEYLVADHAVAGVECLDCHEPTLEQQINELKVQISGDYRVPLAKMETDDEFCLRDGCHTREEIVEATSNYTVEGVPVNVHAQKVSPTTGTSPHVAEDAVVQECSTCHTMHRKSGEWTYCYGCHHSETFEDCQNCHDHR